MRNWKKGLRLAILYILTFAAALAVTSVIENYGISSGTSSESTAAMPVLYISGYDTVLNEMYAYTQNIDCGYIRESICVTDDEGTLQIGIRNLNTGITSLRYTLSDAENETIMEVGALTLVSEGSTFTEAESGAQTADTQTTDAQTSDTQTTDAEAVETGTFQEEDTDGEEQEADAQIWELSLKRSLDPDTEYCLTITLTDEEENVYYYYTRLMDGEDLDLSEKLAFVLEFQQDTMDEDKSSEVEAYLTTSSSQNDNTSFTNVDIYSSTSMVMWGDLSVQVSGSITAMIKAVEEDTATIRLLYTVETEDGEGTSAYYIADEYYMVQQESTDEGDVTWTLLEFSRSLSEITRADAFEAEEALIRLGIVQESDIKLLSFEGEDSSAAVFVLDGCMWYYDIENDLMTCIYDADDEEALTPDRTKYDMQALSFDEDGTVYFIVYGYMTDGLYAGQTGVLLYSYDPDTNQTQELAFVSTDYGYDMLIMNVEKMAYMDEDRDLYLCLEDIVYRFDYVNGQVSQMFDALDEREYELNQSGYLMVTQYGTAEDGDAYLMLNWLLTGESRKLSSDDAEIVMIGFLGDDLIYGTTQASLVLEDASGEEVILYESLVILDSEGNVIREYTADGDYISNVEITDGSLILTLAQLSLGGSDYTETGTDFLVYNEEEEDEAICLTTIYDSTYRNEVWLDVSASSLDAPITRSALLIEDSGSVYTMENTLSTQSRYYLYSSGSLVGDYSDIRDAITACEETLGGVVVSSDKQVVWQELTRSSDFEIEGFPSVEQTEDTITSVTAAICAFAEEKTESEVSVDSSMNMLEALQSNLTEHTVINLSGLTLDEVLYFVYTGSPVVVATASGQYAVIIGCDDWYMQIANPISGETSDWNLSYFTEVFEEEGNIFYSYY